MTRHCTHCDKPLVRRYRESHRVFAARTCCSRTCLMAAKETARRAKVAHIVKHCPHCNELLTQRPGESNQNFVKRKTCGQECALAKRRVNAMTQDDRNAAERARRAAARAATPRPERTPATRRKPTAFAVTTTNLPITQLKRERHETIRLEALGEPCPVHPGEKVGYYGCCACNASAKWRAEQRQLKGRPHADTPGWPKRSSA